MNQILHSELDMAREEIAGLRNQLAIANEMVTRKDQLIRKYEALRSAFIYFMLRTFFSYGTYR